MNISVETIQKLESDYNFNFYDAQFRLVNDPKTATEMRVNWQILPNGECQHIGKTIKATKKEVTYSAIIQKISDCKVYESFAPKFKAFLLTQNIGNYDVYATTYGIGLFVAFDRNEQTRKDITDALNALQIQFSTEHSDAFLVLRYKISKSSENVKRIESFLG